MKFYQNRKLRNISEFNIQPLAGGDFEKVSLTFALVLQAYYWKSGTEH